MHDVVFGQAPGGLGETTATASMAGQIAGGAPIWVWPLLVALIALGGSRMRDREMAIWRLMLLPAILGAMSVFMAVNSQLAGSSVAAAIAGAVAGGFTGWWSLRNTPAMLLGGNRVRVKGEVVSMIAILVIFVARFASGAVSATSPGLASLPAVSAVFAALPAFCAALMVARALAQAGINPLQRQGGSLTGAADC